MNMLVSLRRLNRVLKKRDNERIKKTILCVLALLGAVAAVAGIAYAVYRYLTPNYLKDFEEDFEDDFDEYIDVDDVEEE